MRGGMMRGAIVVGCAIVAAACSERRQPRGAVGVAVAAAIRAGLDASARERAPWRCGALDGPAPQAAGFAIGATPWTVDGRIARRARSPRPRPIAIAFVADAEAPTPATLAALAGIRTSLMKLGVDAVVALGGMGGTADELAAVYGALAGPWPVLAIPGDREPWRGLHDAVDGLAAAGVLDGTRLRWLVIDGVGIATLPGQPYASRLAHGPDGCGHTDADVAALLAAPPAELGFRILATQRAPRHPGDHAALGAPAGDPGLAAAIAGRPGQPAALELVVHASLDGPAAAAGSVRRGQAVAAIATGVASASARLDGTGRRVTPAAVVVRIDGGAATWQVIGP